MAKKALYHLVDTFFTINGIYKLHLYNNGSCKFLHKKRRSFLKPISKFRLGLRGLSGLVNLSLKGLLGMIFLFVMHGTVAGQSLCTECEVQIPDSLQVDTFYLQEFPDGSFRLPYEANVSFRLPANTTEVLYLDPSLPPNLNINKVNITSIANLPAGLVWEANQNEYSLPDERNGCVRICGTPLQFGLFEVDITVTAQVSIISRSATFSRQLLIAPPSSENKGFTMTNNIGCGNTTVAFTNNNPSEGQAGFRYEWDFGNGMTSKEEQPTEQTYSSPGIYPVNYQVITDTLGSILTAIEVVEASCDDLLNKPDFYIRIYDPLDTLIFENSAISNTDAPITVPMNMPIGAGEYRLEVWDDDRGLGFKDDSCGAVFFNAASTDTLQDDDLKVLLSIIQTADTTRVQDSVVVFERPTAPIISLAETFFCEGDSVILNTTYSENTEWFMDGLPIANARDSFIVATEMGEYHVSYTSPEGCVVFSEAVFLETIPTPPAPIFSNTDNILRLFDASLLPTNSLLQWYQEGNLLAEEGQEICISENGMYGLEVLDMDTGCSTLYETSIVANESIDCTTATTDLSAYVSSAKLYPNPTTGLFYLEINLHQPIETPSLQIINALGQIVYQQHFTNLSNSQQLELNLAAQARGLYWVVLKSREGVSSWKILKE